MDSYLTVNCYDLTLCNSCWIESDDGAILAFIVPIGIIMLVCVLIIYFIHACASLYSFSLQINCMFLGITLKVLCIDRSIDEKDIDKAKYLLFHKSAYLTTLIYRDLLKATIVLLPLLGLTWIIGILAVNNETQVFAWIFAILNSLQVIKVT